MDCQARESALHDLMENHGRLVMNVVHELVANIDNLDHISEKLTKLGMFHVKNEVPLRYLDIMGPIFCNAVRPILLQSDAWSPDVEDSWMELFKVVTSLMAGAYKSVTSPPRFLSLSPTQELLVSLFSLRFKMDISEVRHFRYLELNIPEELPISWPEVVC